MNQNQRSTYILRILQHKTLKRGRKKILSYELFGDTLNEKNWDIFQGNTTKHLFFLMWGRNMENHQCRGSKNNSSIKIKLREI